MRTIQWLCAALMGGMLVFGQVAQAETLEGRNISSGASIIREPSRAKAIPPQGRTPAVDPFRLTSRARSILRPSRRVGSGSNGGSRDYHGGSRDVSVPTNVTKVDKLIAAIDAMLRVVRAGKTPRKTLAATQNTAGAFSEALAGSDKDGWLLDAVEEDGDDPTAPTLGVALAQLSAGRVKTWEDLWQIRNWLAGGLLDSGVRDHLADSEANPLPTQSGGRRSTSIPGGIFVLGY